jgi:hypothetical protein
VDHLLEIFILFQFSALQLMTMAPATFPTAVHISVFNALEMESEYQFLSEISLIWSVIL